MNDNHRELIIKNIDKLVYLTDYEMLCKACLKYNLLNNIMLHNIQRTEPCKQSPEICNERTIRLERHKRLFIKITKRGPDAFGKLQQIFSELKYRDASNLLFDFISINKSKQRNKAVSGEGYENEETNNNDQENIPNNNIDDSTDSTENLQLQRTFSNDNDETLHEYRGEIEPKKTVNVIKAKEILKHPNIPTYKMESEHHRGVLFMVNIIDFPNDEDKRLGAEVDSHALLALFQQMNFKLYAYENLTKEKFFSLLDDLLQTEVVKLTECFVLALMTHGELIEGIQFVQFHDGLKVNVEEIEKRFYHENCEQLVGKPKILIFPYCRGNTNDKGVIVADKTQTEGTSSNSRRSINNIVQLSDVIKCYATRVGFVSHRDVAEGSWYIQNFVDTLAAHAHNTAFEDMLKIVQTGITKMRTEKNEVQTPSYNNIGFNKILYFNPGFYIS